LTFGTSCPKSPSYPESYSNFEVNSQRVKRINALQEDAQRIGQTYIQEKGYVYECTLGYGSEKVYLSRKHFKEHNNLLMFTFRGSQIRVQKDGELTFNRNDCRRELTRLRYLEIDIAAERVLAALEASSKHHLEEDVEKTFPKIPLESFTN
jgi:hypothetical protein